MHARKGEVDRGRGLIGATWESSNLITLIWMRHGSTARSRPQIQPAFLPHLSSTSSSHSLLFIVAHSMQTTSSNISTRLATNESRWDDRWIRGPCLCRIMGILTPSIWVGNMPRCGRKIQRSVQSVQVGVEDLVIYSCFFVDLYQGR